MKMRLAWYAGVSTGLAATVVLSAFHQRANFYSAMVHLAQSSLSLMVRRPPIPGRVALASCASLTFAPLRQILINLIFLIYGFFMYGLQRVCFGQLRPVEIEQLYEKAWFAVTETCLAMTIFREEIGAFFLVMFTALVTGKVWGWIGEGRVEILEQQPPANPRLFHARLTVSLLLSVIYDTWLLSYAFRTVVEQARPTMMVMFLFEFAVLNVCSFQTGFRYIVSLIEQRVVTMQTRQRLDDRRRQAREARAEILRQRELDGDDSPLNEADLPNPDDIDEMDIEVPGWEAKGQWILTLDLVADFVKLVIYTAFFCVLFTFYGLPIHIMRDWFMTTRSFLKRLGALIRYRQALKDMDQYPDATAEELERENTCIICREEMHAWDPDQGQVERTRPKKLPCGHILHFGCLKSWLERQQVCPTCRTPVVRERQQQGRNGDAVVFRLGLNLPAGQNQQAPAPGANGQGPEGDQGGQGGQGDGQNNQNNRNNGVRMFNLGPLRLGFAQGPQDIQEMAQRMGVPPDMANNVLPTPAVEAHPPSNTPAGLDQLRNEILQTAQRVQQEMQSLQNAASELHMMNLLAQELTRLREIQQMASGVVPQPPEAGDQLQPNGQLPNIQQPARQPQPALFQPPMFGAAAPFHPPPLFQLPPHAQRLPHFVGQPTLPGFNPFQAPAVTRYGGTGYGAAIPAGSAELPDGVVIPPGWSLLPLERLEGGAPPASAEPQPSTSQRSQTPFQEMVNIMAPELNAYIPRPGRPNGPTVAPPAAPNPSDRPSAPSTSQEPAEVAGDSTHNSSGPSAGLNRDAMSFHTTPVAQSTAAPPPVTAPTPVMPNWGGSAQLFGGSDGVFGYQARPSQGDASSTASHPAEGSETSTEQSSSGNSTGEASSSRPAAENRGVDSKGKTRAVTVEEASDSDEDSD
ncbi:hypothetical protein GQ53DRAFT_705617 [Thozetella sp. PMI_491]|nr:hypothetical protein GQ53DRAFT_705617 [Thozetella sp. PMI_491]